MKKEKKYLGVYLDTKTNKYYVSTTFTTKDGYKVKKCKRGFDTAKKADTWKQQTAIEIANSSYGSITGGKVGVAKLIDEYVKYRKATLKPLTLRQIDNALNKHFLPYFNMEAQDIKVNDIFTFYNALANSDLSNATKNLVVHHTLQFIDYLDITEAIATDIYRKFKKILQKFDTSIDKIDKNKTFTKDEVDMIINYFDTDKKSDRTYKLLFQILANTGCRIGEALALEFDDVNFITNSIHFYKQAQKNIKEEFISNSNKHEKYYGTYIFYYTKTNSTKNVVIPQWLIDEIIEYKENNQNKYIFVSTRKNLVSMTTAEHMLKKALNDLGLENRGLHAFRHYHTSQMYELGLDSKYIAERLGHADETTSMKVYKHLSNEKIEAENQKLMKFLS